MKTTDRMIYSFKRPGTPSLLAIIAAFACLLICSCQKYLDARPDKSLEVPTTLPDFQALMDDNNINILMPQAADMASDDYFLSSDDWLSFPLDARNNYVWDPQAADAQDWDYAYSYVLSCNVVLEGLAKTPVSAATAGTANQIRAEALFYRGCLFYQLAGVFTMPYSPGSSGTELGIPLKLKSDITEKIKRPSLEATYQQILTDLKGAAAFLPVVPKVKTRPSKPAAYGALARVYLEMQDYRQANLYADSCLQLYSKLIDYNTLDTTAVNPIALFNDEVIFHATSSGTSGMVSPGYARVDTALYASYAGSDLRKVLFYTYADNGHYAFKGDYSGQSFGSLFSGVATDEVLLIRAETYARLGKTVNAMDDLNTLLGARYLKGTYAPYPETMAQDAALALILAERRKELAFRSALRWADLKRLNQDVRYAKSIMRVLNGQAYTLLPNDKRYAFLIPVSVVQLSGIPQNSR